MKKIQNLIPTNFQECNFLKKNILSFFAFLLLSMFGQTLAAQTPTQTIRGQILDADAQFPLVGATVVLLGSDPLIGTTADKNGEFRLENISVGRASISVSYLGYESQTLSSLTVGSGKELVLKIELMESTNSLTEVVVKAERDKARALNEMATVSARTFSTEETSRYAASFYDPGRMAQSFAGVSTGGPSGDLSNEIVVRGNSPRGVLWRMEGMEIENPNHYGELGSSGGPISMLSSSTLSNSDFYTGAFPAEFGNAISGVFDINLRKGNDENREYAFMFGALGIEAAAEGPLGKKNNATYLLNYRYSTLSMLDLIGLSPVDDVVPAYQDLSFNFHFPKTRIGEVSLFGLAGISAAKFTPVQDSAEWEDDDDREGFTETAKLAIVGLTHKKQINESTYTKTVIGLNVKDYVSDSWYIEDDFYQRPDEREAIRHTSYRLHSFANKKFNAKNTIRTGLLLSDLSFRFILDEADPDTEIYETLFDNDGSGQTFEYYLQWKHRLNERLTLNSGVHYSHFFLNNQFSVEPRFSVSYKLKERMNLAFSAGLHSKLEHLSVYTFDGTWDNGESTYSPNKDLKYTKSAHLVLAHDWRLSDHIRMKTEIYYQHLFDMPEAADPTSTRSMADVNSVFAVLDAEGGLVSTGKGRNYGIDFTLERFFHRNYYFMLTGSIYDSKYEAPTGDWFNTRYNGNYQLNILAGKEFVFGAKKNRILGLNAKIVYSGGNRYTPVDFAASQLEGDGVYFEDQRNSIRTSGYFRPDLGISYKINRKKATHTITLDMQNVINYENLYGQFYDEDCNCLKTYNQTGLFPNFNYRIEF